MQEVWNHMARPEKIAAVEALAEVFGSARSVVLNDFTGLNVEKLSELRQKCRENGIEFRVIKNTLAIRSVEGTEAKDLASYFEGPTALAISMDSENVAAKVLATFAKEHEAPRFKAALVEGSVLDADEVVQLSKLPTKEELLSTLLASLKSPGSNLVGVLQGTLRNLMYAVNAIIDKKKETEGDSGEPPQQ
jgi:large subunit ribosomal protein L10